ncbi:SRPBCC family protein [Streptomyces sp. NPDC058374]|uniref:SRPBCC family protein n=1 Tax=unclassified Streptomyces TaxID=2593676 RepID=UPI0036633E94
MPIEPPQHQRVEARADRTMDRPAGAVWREIADFPALAAWHPAIASSAPHPDGPHLRALVTTDGTEITEELLLDDGARMTQEYAFTAHPFPVTDYRARIAVRPEGDARCSVTWTATFSPLEGDGSEQRAQFEEGVFAPGLEALAERG